MLSRRQREFAGAGISVVGILLLVVAPSWAIEFAVAAMAAGVLFWVSTCPVDRLSLPNGVPRPLLFGVIVVGIGAHLSVVRFLTEITGSRLLLTVSLVLLAGGLATGLVRVLWYRGPPPTE
ncbi:MAG: hypothetical protein OEY55_12775 [Acidimicrobiia bacterium]|nr:hypothetical protein [Acidimicrobiia bacterium]MDH5504109.1 hypothetical protein [Acidimicrobiia bacterium]